MPILSLLIMVVIAILLVVVIIVGYVLGQVAWSLCCTLVIRMIRPEGKRATWITLSTVIFPPLYLIAIVLWLWSVWPDKQDAFYTAFGTPPSSTVTVHKGEADGFADSLSIELYFTASPTDIQMIIAQGLTLNPNYDPTTDFQNSVLFNPISLAGKDIYTGESAHQQYYSEHAVLIVDRTTNEVWYFFLGID